MSDICFKDLCGKHLFSGCELTSEFVIWWGYPEKSGVCLFTLDGVTYKAIENPGDGYLRLRLTMW